MNKKKSKNMSTHFYTIVSRKRNVFFLVCNLALFISCKKFEPEDLPVEKENITPTMLAAVPIKFSSQDLLYEETFEGLGPSFYPGTLQVGTSYGFTPVSDLLFQGKKVARFELRDTDPSVSSGTRVEAK